MQRKMGSFVSVVGVMTLGVWFANGQGQVRTSSEATTAPLTTVEEMQVSQMGGGGGKGGGCSGCFCCFPRTPAGNVNMNGIEPTGSPTVVYTVPEDKWLILTDIEVVVLDAQGEVADDLDIGLFEVDDMGMRTLKRWANCSAYHSARGIAIRPGCEVTLDRFAVTPNPTAQSAVASYYYQLNGYLWDGTSSEH